MELGVTDLSDLDLEIRWEIEDAFNRPSLVRCPAYHPRSI